MTSRRRPTGTPSRQRSAPGRTEPAVASLGVGQLGYLRRLEFDERQHEKLGDAISGFDPKDLGRVGVEQQDANLTPIAGIDQTGSVDQGDAVLQSQTRPGKHQTGMTLGYLDSQARLHLPPLARSNVSRFRGMKIETGVTRGRSNRDYGFLAQSHELEIHSTSLRENAGCDQTARSTNR